MPDHPDAGGAPVPDALNLRAPPHSADAERALIGSVMVGADWSLVSHVKPPAFYLPQHRFVWEAVAAIAGDGTTPDAVLVSERLAERQLLERVGGNAYIAELVDGNSGKRNAVKFADIVLDRAGWRERLRAANELQEAVLSGDAVAMRAIEAKMAANGWTGGDRPWTIASEIEMLGVDWLWHHWLPSGHFTLFAAPGGSGKGTFCCHLVACMTNRVPWPNGKITEPRPVAYYTAEDAPKQELMPRLVAAGVDTDAVFVLHTAEAALNPPKSVAMVIVDPVGAGFSGDGNAQTEVRPFVMQWTELAERLDIAVLGIHHFGKFASTKSSSAARDLAIGSTAWVDCSRWLLMMARDRSDEENSRILIRGKGNLGGVDYSHGAYRVRAEHVGLGTDRKGRIIENKRICGIEYVDADADESLFDALKPPSREESTADNDSAGEVMTMLRAAGGVLPRKRIIADATASENTVDKWLQRLVDDGVIEKRRPEAQERVDLGVATSAVIYSII